MVSTEGSYGYCGDNAGSGAKCDLNGTGANPDPIRTVGWRFDLDPGERVVSDVMVRDRKLIVITNVPEGGICSADASSWVMALDACSGARLTEVQFDTDGDGVVNDQDIIQIDDPANPGSKIEVVPTAINYDGRLQAPAILMKGKEEQLYMSSSKGNIEIQAQKAARLGLVYWRMFRP
jgi:Tfp pilus tip-associated adhesin PilY1